MNLESALEKLYEDVSVSDSLDDTAGQMLLKWAEGQLARLYEANPDGDAFDTAFEKLRGLLRSIGRYTDRLPELDLSSQTQALTAMSGTAQELGVPLHVDTPIAQTAGLSNAAIVAALIGAAPAPPTAQKGTQVEAQTVGTDSDSEAIAITSSSEVLTTGKVSGGEASAVTPSSEGQTKPSASTQDITDPWADLSSTASTAEETAVAESQSQTLPDEPVDQSKSLLETILNLVRSAAQSSAPEVEESEQSPPPSELPGPTGGRPHDDNR